MTDSINTPARRPALVVRTLEELGLLPHMSIVVTRFAGHRPHVARAWQRFHGNGDHTDWAVAGDRDTVITEAEMPARVVWMPSGEFDVPLPGDAWEQGYCAARTDVRRRAWGTPGFEYTTNPYTVDDSGSDIDIAAAVAN